MSGLVQEKVQEGEGNGAATVVTEAPSASAPSVAAMAEGAPEGASELAPEGGVEGEALAADNPSMRWYMLQVHSGFEKQVKAGIEEQVEDDEHLRARVGKVMIPTEEVVEVRRGQKQQVERKLFPGYLFVRAEMDDVVAHVMRNLPKVTGWLGAANTPLALSKAEEDRLLEQMREGVARVRPAVIFHVGEKVRVAHGPFSSFNGVVEEVDEERARLKVSVSIFGRSTPVDLEYGQVEKP